MTAMTPHEDGVIEMTHLVYWTMPWLNAFRPLLHPFVRRFIRQDSTVMEQQQQGPAPRPPMLYINDADVLIRWYYRLRNEYAASRRDKRAFVNPLKPRVLRYRT